MSIPDFLRGRRGAFLAVGVLAVLFVAAVALPVTAMFEAQAQDRREALAQLAAYRAQEAQRPVLDARLAALQEGAKSVPGLLTASSAELAQAQLQSNMKELIDKNGGSLLSAQLLPPTKVKGFDSVSIEYDVTIPLSNFSSLVYAVETHVPYYFVDSADFVMPPNWRPTSPIQDPSMEMRWTIHAYRWRGSH
ncbi:MAG TPA: type II secretion system protein GspM [Rhizomicrobium sp.]|nr:type II secretion system protein GspM [Rhizomicrobium sp.]